MGFLNNRNSLASHLLPVLAMAVLLYPSYTAQAAPVTGQENFEISQAISSSLTIRGQGMAPNQVVTLATSPTQKFTATTDRSGAVVFNNLKYTPTEELAFSISYLVKGSTEKTTQNSILMTLDPFTGSVAVKGNATRAASVIVSVSAQDSEAMVANQNGFFAGTADALNGLTDGALQVVASIINVEENCCPRSIKPYAPVKITISGQPVKKADNIISSTETAELSIDLPAHSYGAQVSVPASMVNDSWVSGFNNFANRVVEALQNQATSFGTFLNAQQNINARQSLQKRQAAAAKTYAPSEQLCRFGTLGQSLASSEAQANFNKLALMKSLENNEMGVTTSGSTGADTRQSRLNRLRSTNCDPSDMNGVLRKYCKENKNQSRYNQDVDYTSAIDVPMTLAVNFSSPTGSAQEQDILSMAENLFPPQSLQKAPSSSGYMNVDSKYRSLQAIRSVAKNSFATLVTEKAQGTTGSALYIKNLVKALGVPEGQAERMMGDKPSYFAQMEVLTKKLYQDPAFYLNLIDTPANVARQRAAIRAVKLQQQNDFAQVVKRREMLLAVLLELKLRERSKSVSQRLKPNQ